jgi:hypothetical protein
LNVCGIQKRLEDATEATSQNLVSKVAACLVKVIMDMIAKTEQADAGINVKGRMDISCRTKSVMFT